MLHRRMSSLRLYPNHRPCAECLSLKLRGAPQPQHEDVAAHRLRHRHRRRRPGGAGTQGGVRQLAPHCTMVQVSALIRPYMSWSTQRRLEGRACWSEDAQPHRSTVAFVASAIFAAALPAICDADSRVFGGTFRSKSPGNPWKPTLSHHAVSY